MACPYFMPTDKLENGEWAHAGRLPLGCGWSGRCTVPGHEESVPSPEELRDFCNLGYAEGCSRLPRQRVWDSVRFGARSVAGDGENSCAGHVEIRYVCERNHRPVEYGTLSFDAISANWKSGHPDSRVQRMAECFLATYLEKKNKYREDQAAS